MKTPYGLTRFEVTAGDGLTVAKYTWDSPEQAFDEWRENNPDVVIANVVFGEKEAYVEIEV